MKKIIVANWKCNPASLREARRMFLALKAGVRSNKAEVVICPPFVYLTEAAKIFKGGKIKLGSQDCFWAENGPHTGEVSPLMLKSIGVRYVILGHSERRAMGESRETVVKKIKAALKNNLTPIVCLGETAEQRNNKETFQVLERQVKETLGCFAPVWIKKIIIVYEPIWAISTTANSRGCSSDDALTAILFLRKLLAKMIGSKAGQGLSVLYGGSVGGGNIKEYSQNEAIGGLLVGGASLDVKEFLKISQSNV